MRDVVRHFESGGEVFVNQEPKYPEGPELNVTMEGISRISPIVVGLIGAVLIIASFAEVSIDVETEVTQSEAVMCVAPEE